jgi:hypothetical protein
MLPTFDFTDCKAQGQNYHEHNIAGQEKNNLVLGEAMLFIYSNIFCLFEKQKCRLQWVCMWLLLMQV